MWQAKAGPKVPSIALKMTKYNGVFETNPAEHADARQYARISAEYMLAHYDALSAVDRQCLEVLRSAGSAGLEVHLQIYAADYTIAQALEDETLGTIITSLPVEPQFVSGQR
jgi:uridylate kinase